MNLEEYSDGVKKRIAKLTKRMREVRTSEENRKSTKYAKSVVTEQRDS